MKTIEGVLLHTENEKFSPCDTTWSVISNWPGDKSKRKSVLSPPDGKVTQEVHSKSERSVKFCRFPLKSCQVFENGVVSAAK